jgi:ligand-binding sensor domain-containing protein
LLFAVLLQAQPLITSEYNYKHFGIPDGLPTEMIECVFQDSRGFIWFGAEHGFVRYDGQTFKKYLSDKSRPINKIEENERGEIVIYGYHHILVLDVNTDQLRLAVDVDNINYSVGRSPGLPSGYSLYDKRDNNNTIGLFHFQNDTLVEVFSHPRLNETDYGQSIYMDRATHLYYIPTKDKKVYVVSETGEEKAVYHNLYVCRFVKTRNEVLAVGTEGVWRMTKSGFELKYKFKNKKTLEEDFNVVADADGNVIMTTEKNLLRCKDGQLETIIDNINIPRSLLFDSEGNLWFTSRQGIYNFFKMNLITYRVNGENADIVYSIVPTQQDELYIATANGKLIRFDNQGYEELHYPPYPSGRAEFSCQSLKVDDAIYFPTYDAILQYKNGRFRWLNLPPKPYYVASCRINDREFAMGGYNSLKLFKNDGSLIREILHQEIGRTSIYTVQVDDRQRLWVGGFKGICRISESDTLYFYNENTRNAESSDKDRNGRIWFGCESHIYYVEGDSIRLFMEFPNTVIINLRVTRDNLLVLSDNLGIKIIDIETKRVAVYNYTNGYSAGEPSWDTMTEDGEGNIWMATQGPNIVKFNPAQLLNNNYRPVLYLAATQCSPNNVDWEEMTNRTTVDYHRQNFRFSFVGICYSNPENVRYHYRLLGFQDEWSPPVTGREVMFNNLAPGNYEFQLYADMGTYETQTPVITYSFTIHPAFWQTSWFLIVALLMLMLTSAGVALYIQHRKNRVLMERLETEKQLNELRIKSIRLKAIPHFNANVLAAIEYYIMNLSKTEALRLLGIYSQFMLQTLREVDKASRTLNEELEYVKMYLELEKLRFIDKFDYRIEIDPTVDTGIQLPNMILHTYCENAVKHGLSSKSSDGWLWIKAVQNGNQVSVSVEDNGIGREKARQNKTVRSSKQGLEILSRQIEIYNRFNKIKINQQVDDLYADGQPSGTRFTVEVPCDFIYQ